MASLDSWSYCHQFISLLALQYRRSCTKRRFCERLIAFGVPNVLPLEAVSSQSSLSGKSIQHGHTTKKKGLSGPLFQFRHADCRCSPPPPKVILFPLDFQFDYVDRTNLDRGQRLVVSVIISSKFMRWRFRGLNLSAVTSYFQNFYSWRQLGIMHYVVVNYSRTLR